MADTVGDSVARRFDAIIFDLDGVIVDTELVWESVRSAFAASHGRRWGPEHHRLIAQTNSAEWAAIMRERLGLDVPAPFVERAIVDGMVHRLRTDGPPRIEGAVDAVRTLAAAYPSAIASSAHIEIIDATLAATGLTGLFGAVVSADEVGRGKPHPDVFLEAARRLDVPPDRCLVVEDALNGVLAARAAGMTVVLVPNPSMPPYPGAEEAASYVLDRLDRLDPERLDEIARPGGGR